MFNPKVILYLGFIYAGIKKTYKHSRFFEPTMFMFCLTLIALLNEATVNRLNYF